MQSIKTNYIYNTLYQILSLFIPFITAPYISRVLGTDGIGEISYVASIAAYFVLFASLGSASYAKREIALHRDDKRKTSIIFWEIEILLVLLTTVCLVIWGFLVALSKQHTLLFVVQSIQILTVSVNLTWFFGGEEQFKLISIRNSLLKVAQIVFLFLFIKDKSDLLLYVFITNGFDFLGYISLIPVLRKYIQRIPLKELHPMRHFKSLIQYFLPTIASSVYQYLDKVMLGSIGNDLSQNGYYEQTTKIVNMILGVTISLDTIMESRMSYLFAKGRSDELRQRLNRSVDFTLGISIPACIGLCGVASTFIPWFLGKDFLPVVPLLMVYSTTLISTSLCCCLGGQYLIPSGQRNRSTKVLILVSFVNLILNAFSIPYIGALGATIATVISEALCMVLYIHLSKNHINWRVICKLSYKKILTTIPMIAVLLIIGHLLPANIFTIILQVGTGLLIYIIGTLLLRDSFSLFILDFLKSKIKFLNRFT